VFEIGPIANPQGRRRKPFRLGRIDMYRFISLSRGFWSICSEMDSEVDHSKSVVDVKRARKTRVGGAQRHFVDVELPEQCTSCRYGDLRWKKESAVDSMHVLCAAAGTHNFNCRATSRRPSLTTTLNLHGHVVSTKRTQTVDPTRHSMAVLNLLGAYEGLCYPNRARGRSLPDELIEEYGGADQSGNVNVNVSVRKAHAEQFFDADVRLPSK
jgi:hypothetical protein